MTSSLTDLRTAAVRYHRSPGPLPAVVAAASFGALAIIRVLGAFDDLLMTAAIALTPVPLALVPRSSWPHIGLRAPRGTAALARGMAVVIASYLAALTACAVFLGRGEDNWVSLLPGLFRSMFPGSTVLAYVTMFVSMAVLVPLAEEVFYRGILLHAVSRHTGMWLAVTVVSACWTFVHIGDYGLAPFNGAVLAGMLPSVFLMGLALGYCRVVTDSVVATTVAQGTANVIFTIWAISL